MASTRTANPVAILDELEKAGTSKEHGSIYGVLLSALEPSTASRVEDAFLQMPVDMSHVTWIFCVNSLEGLPQPLLSRVSVVRVDEPEREHAEAAFPSLVAGVAEDFKVSPSAMPSIPGDAVHAMLDDFEAHRSIRLLKRQIREAVAALVSPRAAKLSKDARKVAVHEAGHAVVAALKGNVVAKATVQPTGLVPGANGYVLHLPKDRDAMATADSLSARLAIAMAGHAAEKVFFGHGGTGMGASGDIATATATATARRMVALGLSRLGIVADPASAKATEEVERMLNEALEDATRLITRHRDETERFAATLVAKGTLGREEIASLLPAESRTTLLARLKEAFA